ncbi:MAG: PD-(D/E)XK nuclease family protein [Verrucomicrobiota bacterium]
MGEDRATKPRVQLRLGTSSASLWRELGLPWLRRWSQSAWRESAPVVVLVPNRAAAFYGKSLAVRAGLNLLALEFWTPADARLRLRQLLPTDGGDPASNETVDLLLRLAARTVAEASPANLSARSIAANPSAFRRVLDRVEASGLDLADGAPAWLRPVICRWNDLMRDARLWPRARIDFELEALASRSRPKLAACLCLGFTGEHWPAAPLVMATLATSEEKTTGLTAPISPGEEADQLWVSTVEERFGAYEILDEESEADGPGPLNLHLARNLTEEADLIAARAVEWLAEEPRARIGLVIPPTSELGLLVTERLAEWRLPIFSQFGQRRPGLLEDAGWQAWLAFLEEPGLEKVLALAEALDPVVLGVLAGVGPGADFGYPQLVAVLGDAFEQVMTNDLDVLTNWLRLGTRAGTRQALTLLERLQPLPDEGELDAMWSALQERAVSFGWSERVELLSPRATELLAGGGRLRVGRLEFVRWLRALSSSREFSRLPETAHYYARVNVVGPSEAAGQEWTHLFLAGQTEGEWPPPRQGESYLSRQDDVALAARWRETMKSGVREGSQGEGQAVLPPGITWLLPADAATERAGRDFQRLLEANEEAGTALAVSAHLGTEAAPSLPLQPGEFFLKAYRLAAERDIELPPVLDGRAMDRLAAQSRRFVPPGDSGRGEPSPPLGATAEAYRQRRSGNRYGGYEFCLEEGAAPPFPLRLSCGQWEQALRRPASAFLRHLLGVESPREFTVAAAYARARGIRTHDWLRAMLPRPEESSANLPQPLQVIPSADHLRQRVEARARQYRRRVESAFEESGSPVPVGWLAMWEETWGLADQLAAVIPGLDGFSHAATEWTLAETPYATEGGQSLWLRGRLDGLLGDGEDWQEAGELLILDYKTGASSDWTPGSLAREANGLQLVLYARTLASLTGKKVEVAMIAPAFGLGKRRGAEEFDSMGAAWRDLAAIQEHARFGWRLPVRSAHGAAEDLPLATLPLPEKLGRQKWKREHPGWESLL